MTLFVNSLIECACELLHRMNQDLLALAIHLETLGECLALSLDEALTSEDHIALDLMSVDIHLASGLVKRV